MTKLSDKKLLKIMMKGPRSAQEICAELNEPEITEKCIQGKIHRLRKGKRVAIKSTLMNPDSRTNRFCVYEVKIIDKSILSEKQRNVRRLVRREYKISNDTSVHSAPFSNKELALCSQINTFNSVLKMARRGITL